MRTPPRAFIPFTIQHQRLTAKFGSRFVLFMTPCNCKRLVKPAQHRFANEPRKPHRHQRQGASSIIHFHATHFMLSLISVLNLSLSIFNLRWLHFVLMLQYKLMLFEKLVLLYKLMPLCKLRLLYKLMKTKVSQNNRAS